MAKSDTAVKGVTLDDILLEKRTITVHLPLVGNDIDVTYNPSKYTDKVAALINSPKGTDREWLVLMDAVLNTVPTPTPLDHAMLDRINAPQVRAIALAILRDYFPPDEPKPEAAAGESTEGES